MEKEMLGLYIQVTLKDFEKEIKKSNTFSSDFTTNNKERCRYTFGDYKKITDGKNVYVVDNRIKITKATKNGNLMAFVMLKVLAME